MDSFLESKGLKKILDRAAKMELSQDCVAFLKETQMNLRFKDILLRYFGICKNKGINDTDAFSEVEYCYKIYFQESVCRKDIGVWEALLGTGLIGSYPGSLNRQQKKIIANVDYSQKFGTDLGFFAMRNFLRLMIFGYSQKAMVSIMHYYLNKICIEKQKPDTYSPVDLVWPFAEIPDILMRDIEDDFEASVLKGYSDKRISIFIQKRQLSELAQLKEYGVRNQDILEALDKHGWTEKYYELSEPFYPYCAFVRKFYNGLPGNQESLVLQDVDQSMVDQISAITGETVFVSKPVCALYVTDLKNAIRFNICRYRSIKIENGKGSPFKIEASDQVLLHSDGHMTIFLSDAKYVPLSLKKLFSLMSCCSFFEKIILALMEYSGTQNGLWKDLRCHYLQHKSICLPISVNAVFQNHNKAELFVNTYKDARLLKVNWNKIDMDLGYMLIKSYRKVDEKSRNILQQFRNEDALLNLPYSAKEATKTFISNAYKCILGDAYDNNDPNVINDYVNICFLTHTKISLSARSMKRIQEMHDDVSHAYYNKRTPPVVIPKNTVFKRLRKLLPAEFEWITSRRRLIAETVMQDHCVWSYADMMNKDQCAIYSYVDAEGKRFTLEFVVQNKRYICKQIQGKYNQGNADAVGELVRSFLD